MIRNKQELARIMRTILEKTIEGTLNNSHNGIADTEEDYSQAIEQIVNKNLISGIEMQGVLGKKNKIPFFSNPQITMEGYDFLDSFNNQLNNNQQSATYVNNIHVTGSINNSMLGTQNHSVINNQYTFQNLHEKIESDCLEEDKESMHELLNILTQFQENNIPVEKSTFQKFSDTVKKYDWLLGAAASTLFSLPFK